MNDEPDDATDEGADAHPDDGDLDLARPWPRIFASLLDMAAFIVLYQVFLAVAIGDTGDDPTTAERTVGLVGGLVLSFLLIAVPTALFGRTAGKRVTNVRVVRPDRAGGGPGAGWDAGFRRWVAHACPVFVPGLGPIILLPLAMALSVGWLFTDQQRRSVADRLADTRVVSQPR